MSFFPSLSGKVKSRMQSILVFGELLFSSSFLPAFKLSKFRIVLKTSEVTAHRLSAPDWIVREENDVTLLERRIDHCGMLRDLVAAVEQS